MRISNWGTFTMYNLDQSLKKEIFASNGFFLFKIFI